MGRILDWIDWFTGYERSAARFFLTIVVVNVIVFGTIGYSMATSEAPMTREERLKLDREIGIFTPTDAELDRELSDMMRDIINDVTPIAPGSGAN